jgi:hypothetical protein
MPQASSAPPPASEVPAPAVLRPHDVFEQMGQNMSYATAFNLPPVELRRRFDDIEQAIAGEEQAELRKQNDVSLELSDADFVANLGAPPEPPPTLPDIVVTPVKTPAGSPGDATATVEEAARTVVTVAPPADEASQPPSTIETNDSARSGRQTS